MFWLAAASVLLALLLAIIGAPLVAVIEVSVGACRSVLFVFTIGIAGDEVQERPLVPAPMALALAASATLLLLWLILPFGSPPTGAGTDVSLSALADVLLGGIVRRICSGRPC